MSFDIRPRLLAIGGLIAMASAIGIGRFIYTPILPPMAEGLHLTKGEAGLIASANFLGYLAGAVAAASPLQQACAMAMGMDDAYFDGLSAEYAERKTMLTGLLEHAGFRCFDPKGAYYVMTDISAFKYVDDAAFVRHLITHLGVAAVPGSSFFAHTNLGNQFVRFCFCKKYETLEMARQQLNRLY